MDKLIIFSAPSGSGKSTIINYLLEQNLGLEFSISATSRAPRGEEKQGKEYYFISVEEFRQKIADNEFLEYEEVYKDRFYGTLYSEVERLGEKGHVAIFDVDVVGASHIKECYKEKALSVFIKPPSIGELRKRLESRGTEKAEVIDSRVARAEYELTFEPQYDVVVINDDLNLAQEEALQIIKEFLDK